MLVSEDFKGFVITCKCCGLGFYSSIIDYYCPVCVDRFYLLESLGVFFPFLLLGFACKERR